MDSKATILLENGLLTLDTAKWEEAKRRADIIRPLAALSEISQAEAKEAGLTLGLSGRQIYSLVEKYRAGNQQVSDLAVKSSSGGRGRGRLLEAVEFVIRDHIHKTFRSRQRLSVSAVVREIRRTCKTRNLPLPSRKAIESRISTNDPVKMVRIREGENAARKLESAGGVPPTICSPLEQIQIDHTIVDLIIVDEKDRLPIGRPYLTIAIDSFSRCIVGMVVTLEPPSAVSVGLCLVNVVTDKRAWLEQMNVDLAWPMSGKPKALYVDNGADFRSEALSRGCAQHDIKLGFRPPGRPYFGGIVERIIGTAMTKIHELPGTTFSNPMQKGRYDSDSNASLTLKELEKWLALAIVGYHGSVHGSLQSTPAATWASGIQENPPVIVSDRKEFLIDFLPVLRRRIGRTGFMIDYIQYFSSALKPLIARRENTEKYIIRRDPRDLSCIWVLDPTSKYYLQIPYRTLSNPSLTLWEHRAAILRLKERGRAEVDEQLLFKTASEMRNISQDATKKTRKTRRQNERRQHLTKAISQKRTESFLDHADEAADVTSPAKPFDLIEEW